VACRQGTPSNAIRCCTSSLPCPYPLMSTRSGYMWQPCPLWLSHFVSCAMKPAQHTKVTGIKPCQGGLLLKIKTDHAFKVNCGSKGASTTKCLYSEKNVSPAKHACCSHGLNLNKATGTFITDEKAVTPFLQKEHDLHLQH